VSPVPADVPLFDVAEGKPAVQQFRGGASGLKERGFRPVGSTKRVGRGGSRHSTTQFTRQ
jgi:hypothetical protein